MTTVRLDSTSYFCSLLFPITHAFFFPNRWICTSTLKHSDLVANSITSHIWKIIIIIRIITGVLIKSLARPTSRCIFFDGENISFDATLVIYINSTNIPPIMIINRIYETQNILSL